MPKSYWTKVQTPDGLKYFRADDVTDELMAKIKDKAMNDVFYVEYGTTTFAEAEEAYLAGKTLVCREIGETIQQTRMDDLYFLIDYTANGSFVFSNINRTVQTNVRLVPSATYEKTRTSLATPQKVVDTLAAEIAPDYNTVVQKCYDDGSFPIPAGTYVTYLDNTSSSVLQYFYKSKVAIERPDAYTSDPITAPQKWDKVHISDILGTSVFYAEICVTPFADIKAAYDRGDVIMGRSGSDIYPLYSSNLGTSYSDSFTFACLHRTTWYIWTCYQNSTGYEATNGWATPPGMVFFPERANIADEYSNQRTYAVGDLCYNGSLYRCTTAIDVPENWTQAHWTQTTVAAELASRPISTFSFSDDNYPSGNDIWNAVSAGHIPMLERTQMYVTRMYIMTQYGSHGNERDVYFYSFRNRDILRLHTSNGTTWTWTSSDMYDSSLNSTGTNAVQNKTLYAVIGDVETLLAAL